MGIRFSCPNGHKLNVKEQLAGKRAVCPACGARFVIPTVGELTPTAGQLPEGATTAAQSAAAASTAASASVVIALADSPPNTAPALASAAPAPPVANVKASQPPETAAPLVAPAPSAETPFVLPDSKHPAAAVSKYTAHRMRIRRLQTTIAITLLIAVVVLGIVLIWILSRGPETVTARQRSSLAQSSSTYSPTHLLTH
jgi:hypothetical protein